MSSARLVLLRRSVTSLVRRHSTRSDSRNLSRCMNGSLFSCQDNQGTDLSRKYHVSSSVLNQRFSSGESASEFNEKAVVPVFLRAEEFDSKVAVLTQHGQYTYDDLLHYSANLARDITVFVQKWTDLNPKRKAAGRSDGLPLAGERIAFLCDNNLSYVVAQWAVWLCGAIAVPLCKSHPTSELQYFVQDSGACVVLCTETFEDKCKDLAGNLKVPCKVIPQDSFSGDFDTSISAWTDKSDVFGKRVMRGVMYDALATNSYRDRKAVIIYTSGTTGRPKVNTCELILLYLLLILK